MLADSVRVDAYRRALAAAIEPGDVVVDLGAGTGFFALEACRLGASTVYAIETNDAISLLPSLARQYGYADRIHVVQRPSTEVTLDRRADVLVADLRGVSPLFHGNFAVMADARARLLAPDGVMIPQRDILCATLVDGRDLYETVIGGWGRSPFPMAAARSLSVNAFHTDRETPLGRDQDLVPPTPWAELVYGETAPDLVSGALEIKAPKDSVVTGVGLSFEAVLGDAARFSSADIARVYSRGFLPLEQPIHVLRDDAIRVELAARRGMGDHIWAWSTTVRRGETVITSFRQSTFLGQALSRDTLHKDLEGYVPVSSPRARAIARILSGMDGRTPIEVLARTAHESEPGAFANLPEAIVQARQIMRKYG